MPSPRRSTVTRGRGGWSTSRLNGTSRATLSAHSVSTLGLPAPDSSWDSVDFAIPARLASSDRDSPARSRSLRIDAAMRSSGGRDAACSIIILVRSIGQTFALTNEGNRVHNTGHAFVLANTGSAAEAWYGTRPGATRHGTGPGAAT